jgi:hypothetical protein
VALHRDGGSPLPACSGAAAPGDTEVLVGAEAEEHVVSHWCTHGGHAPCDGAVDVAAYRLAPAQRRADTG